MPSDKKMVVMPITAKHGCSSGICLNNPEMPFVTIIIINFNCSKNYLTTCLTSLAHINYPHASYEVLVVDNASSDDSLDFIRKEFPWVRIHALDRNYGQMPAVNRGAKIARGEVLLVLDADTRVTENWLSELVKAAYVDEKIGIAGSKVFFMNAPNVIQYEGGYLNPLGGAFGLPPSDVKRAYQNVRPVGYVIGCNMLIKKNVFNQVGGFDDEYFMYGEEGDLCWRTWLHGYSVIYVPSSVSYHVSGGNTKDAVFEGAARTQILQEELSIKGRLLSLTRVYHGNKNSLATLIKNSEYKNLTVGLIFSFLYATVQLMFLLREKKGKAALLLVAAYLWPIKNLRSIWKKRLIIQKDRVISDEDMYRMELIKPIRDLIRLFSGFA